MLNNILKVQENRSWRKNVMRFFLQDILFRTLSNNCVNDQLI